MVEVALLVGKLITCLSPTSSIKIELDPLEMEIFEKMPNHVSTYQPAPKELYWKKKLEMLSRLLKHFGVKDVKAIVDTYPHDGDSKKTSNILF